MQSLFNSRIFSILHKFSIGFGESKLHGQSRTLMRLSSKVVFIFCSMAGSRILLKIFSVWEMLASCFSPQFTLNYLNIFVGIHHPLNREKISNTFKAMLWWRNSRVVIPKGGGIFQQDLSPCHTAKKWKQVLKKITSRSLTGLEIRPPLNPIENLWSILKIRLLKKDCTTKTKLIDATIDVWYVTKKSLRTAKTLRINAKTSYGVDYR